MNEIKPVFLMLVGLPGSGKSTYAKQLDDYIIHSSDAIREELTGDASDQNLNSKVFETLHKRVKKDLVAGNNVIYDATNISWKRRKAFVRELNKINCEKICKVIATPFEVCLKQNNSRDRKVPFDVIDRMYKNFDIPYYNEGWDQIDLVFLQPEYKYYYGKWSEFTSNYLDFEQDNKHHSLTLGKHCSKCKDYVKASVNADVNRYRAGMELIVAAALHDNGKVYTKTYKNKNDEVTEQAHFYEHEHVGCYNAMFYQMSFYLDVDDINKLDVCALIRWHMILHFNKDWKVSTMQKYEKEFTENEYLKQIEFYDMLHVLHEGDLHAH